ncbi:MULTISPECIES: MFS transporter [Actinosynnema]|uniref:MFS transporter n=1 Tax=Actinosynnema TaxID=40566 RepID=UPI0020A5F411|nr:MFS transporter [Actinosynnema pretiosum]MCP2096134.1 MFS transporter, YNFM family, putative membrane transport protein [Actinosynnema pretiosum]
MNRLTTATAATGFATFALLYAPQPVLPQLAAEFGLTPSGASFAIGAATGALALAVVPLATLSERLGRRRVIVWSLAVAALVGLLLPLAPNYPVLLLLRVLQGLATAGVPAAAMAFLAEEVGALGVGAAIGALVAGNSAGGMVGRLVAGVGVDWLGWRAALGLVGAFGVLCAVLVALFLPDGTTRRAPSTRSDVRAGLRSAVADPVLLCLYAVGLLGTAAFISLFNAIPFRLAGPPLSLPARFAALVFLAYAAGGVCSALAGRLSDRVGRAAVAVGALAVAALGALLTLPDHLAAVGAGLLLFTGGFFAAHATASAWVGARARAKGQSSGVYLFAYYLGSSAGGALGATAYGAWGWPGLTAAITCWLATAATAIALAHRLGGRLAAAAPEAVPAAVPGASTAGP